MSGHTPGPWRVRAYDVRTGRLFDIRAGADVVAYQSDREADARLIAAAPDLLEACKLAVEALKAPADHMAVQTARRIIEIVISKAEGAQ